MVQILEVKSFSYKLRFFHFESFAGFGNSKFDCCLRQCVPVASTNSLFFSGNWNLFGRCHILGVS